MARRVRRALELRQAARRAPKKIRPSWTGSKSVHGWGQVGQVGARRKRYPQQQQRGNRSGQKKIRPRSARLLIPSHKGGAARRGGGKHEQYHNKTSFLIITTGPHQQGAKCPFCSMGRRRDVVSMLGHKNSTRTARS